MVSILGKRQLQDIEQYDAKEFSPIVKVKSLLILPKLTFNLIFSILVHVVVYNIVEHNSVYIDLLLPWRVEKAYQYHTKSHNQKLFTAAELHKEGVDVLNNYIVYK